MFPLRLSLNVWTHLSSIWKYLSVTGLYNLYVIDLITTFVHWKSVINAHFAVNLRYLNLIWDEMIPYDCFSSLYWGNVLCLRYSVCSTAEIEDEKVGYKTSSFYLVNIMLVGSENYVLFPLLHSLLIVPKTAKESRANWEWKLPQERLFR